MKKMSTSLLETRKILAEQDRDYAVSLAIDQAKESSRVNETPVHRSDIKMVFLSNTSSLYKFIDCSHTNCYQCYYSAFLFLFILFRNQVITI